MKLKPSREKVASALKKFGKLRIRTSHDTLLAVTSLALIILVGACLRLLPLRWEIQTGSLHLSEFDPYYQYSITRHMVEHGLLSPYWPTPWIDKTRWYPEGMDMSTSLPSLPMTTAFLYDILMLLGVPISLLDFCVFFPVLMGMLAIFLIYFIGKDFGGKGVGLLAALFLALAPSLLQRTSLGFFDDETTGIVALLLFMYTFLRAVDPERPARSSLKYAIAAGVVLGYFIAGWGAAYYALDITAVFAFAIILFKKYSRKMLISYSITAGLGLGLAINVPCIGIPYLTSPAVIPVAAVFLILLFNEFHNSTHIGRVKLLVALLVCFVIGFVVLWSVGYGKMLAGKFISVIDPFTRAASPIIESVAEHRITSWGGIYYEFGICLIFFMGGLYFTIRNLNHRNMFLVIYGITSLYFASSMVRLMVLFSPAYALLAAIGVVGLINPFRMLLRTKAPFIKKKKYQLNLASKEYSAVAVLLIFIILTSCFVFPAARVYSQADSPVTITAGSLPITPAEPVMQWFDALAWVQTNAGTDVIAAWWDYGYWLTMLGNATTLCDNGTLNNTQIENVGFMYMANETQAVKMMRVYDVKYIVVFTTITLRSSTYGAVAPFVGYGDEGKWMWMARISGKAEDRFISQGWLDNSSTWTDETKFGAYNSTLSKWVWNDVGQNTTIYKMMGTARQEWVNAQGSSYGASIPSDEPVGTLQYLKVEYIAGLDLTWQDAASKYGGIIPLVAIFRVDYPTP